MILLGKRRTEIYKYAYISLYEDIRSVLAMVITDLERLVSQAFRNEKRMFSTLVAFLLNIFITLL